MRCGRRGFWLAMPASMDRLRGIRASRAGPAPYCKILDAQEVKPTRCAILERRDPEFKAKDGQVLCVYSKVTS